MTWPVAEGRDPEQREVDDDVSLHHVLETAGRSQ